MPPSVRIFTQLFIGFPGLLIWLYGCLFAVSGSVSLMGGSARREWLDCLLMFAGGFAAAQIGHGMRMATGILTGDPKLRFAGSHPGERIAWDALVQVTGILSIAAGLAAIVSLGGGNWWRLALFLPAFCVLVWTFRYLLRKRGDLHFKWVQEVAARQVERARMEFDIQRMKDQLEAPQQPGPER